MGPEGLPWGEPATWVGEGCHCAQPPAHLGPWPGCTRLLWSPSPSSHPGRALRGPHGKRRLHPGRAVDGDSALPVVGKRDSWPRTTASVTARLLGHQPPRAHGAPNRTEEGKDKWPRQESTNDSLLESGRGTTRSPRDSAQRGPAPSSRARHGAPSPPTRGVPQVPAAP